MTNSQLLDHACALRAQGKFREAYDEFVLAAKNTDNILEKAGILLNAATNLTQSDQCEAARNQLARVRELLSALDPSNLSPSDKDEIFRVTVGIDIEEAEISSAEGHPEKAIEKLTKILEERESQLKEPRFLGVYDDVQMRRAYFWVDISLFDKAKASLEEVEFRQCENFIFLFYLGHCCLVTKELQKAQRLLEGALSLGPTSHIAFQAHCSLGMTFYELGEYAKAKAELEQGVQTASPRYIKEAKIWKWLEYTCIGLGLKDDAKRYGQLARPS